MFVIVSGTNRPGNHTRKVARAVAESFARAGQTTEVIDLEALPLALFEPSAYEVKPEAFLPYQDAVLAAEGILCVVPEYNGSFPGALKYFIDMLKFPESLVGTPAAFVGLSAGEWGGLRAVEQLEMVFQYRRAHLYGPRVFIKRIHEVLEGDGIGDPTVAARIETLVTGFVPFAKRLGR